MLKEIIGTLFRIIKDFIRKTSVKALNGINEIVGEKNKSFRANTCGIFNLEQYVTIYECCEVRGQSSKY